MHSLKAQVTYCKLGQPWAFQTLRWGSQWQGFGSLLHTPPPEQSLRLSVDAVCAP